MNSLYPSVIRLIERAIQSHVEGYSSGIFPGAEEGWPRLGRHFSLQKEGSHAIIYPWFGVFETALEPIVYIGFSGHPGWCQPVFEEALAARLSEGRTYRVPYRDSLRNEFCFALKEDSPDWLRSGEPAERYEKLLSDFFAEVVSLVGQWLI